MALEIDDICCPLLYGRGLLTFYLTEFYLTFTLNVKKRLLITERAGNQIIQWSK